MTLKHGDVEMKTVTLEVATLKDVKRRAQDAFKGRKQGARISFATPELLFQLMTAKRWELIRMMTGAGPLTIREAARRVDRDVKGRAWRRAYTAKCRCFAKNRGRLDYLSLRCHPRRCYVACCLTRRPDSVSVSEQNKPSKQSAATTTTTRSEAQMRRIEWFFLCLTASPGLMTGE